jgi:hypothetical protein
VRGSPPRDPLSASGGGMGQAGHRGCVGFALSPVRIMGQSQAAGLVTSPDHTLATRGGVGSEAQGLTSSPSVPGDVTGGPLKGTGFCVVVTGDATTMRQDAERCSQPCLHRRSRHSGSPQGCCGIGTRTPATRQSNRRAENGGGGIRSGAGVRMLGGRKQEQ